MKTLSQRIAGVSSVKLALMVRQLRSGIDGIEMLHAEPIAVIGIGCRFPGRVTGPESFWKLLRDGLDAITDPPPGRWSDADYVNSEGAGKRGFFRAGYVDGIDRFDAGFFHISPREATSMDPQQRILLEVAWEALENAALVPASLSATPTGVFVGISNNDYFQQVLRSDGASRVDGYTVTGSALNSSAGRLSYVLGLQGPSMAIDTACSSSLTAIHLACQSLHTEETSLALACGVNAIVSPLGAIALSNARMLAADGRCKTFDAAADGYVRGEGCGVVVLKRLSDALRDGDPVYGVIRGSAVNQDGASGGLTVPNGPAQEAVIQRALVSAGIQPVQVGYVEAHGTGTPLGDPIEVRALARALGAGRVEPLRIGSVKTNIGHLESAAGIAGFIKLVLALHHGAIPPHLHLKQLNPLISGGEFPIEIPTTVTPWTGRRIGGVSSFGASGTNSHLVVESAPIRPASPDLESGTHLLCLSARTTTALREAAENLDRHICANPSVALSDLCYTLAIGRTQFAHSVVLPVASIGEARRKLSALVRGESPDPPVPGAELDQYRSHSSGRKVSLPPYPFQRERYWIDPPALAAETRHPLLGRRLDSALGDTIFETRFTPGSPSFLKDHLVYGVVVVPGACHVALMLSAASQIFGAGKELRLDGVTFFEPLVLAEGSAFSVQTIVTLESAGAGAIRIHSRRAGGFSWTLHAAAKVGAIPATAPEPLEITVPLLYSTPAREFYERVRQVSFHFGPTFQWIDTLHRSDDESVAEIRQPHAVDDEAAHVLHPGLIDACFQTFSAAQASTAMDATAYVPIGIGSFRFYDVPGPKLRCRADHVAGHTDNIDTFTGSFQLRDQSGRLIAEAVDLQIKRAPREALLRAARSEMSDWFYGVDWVPSGTPKAAGVNGSWLIIGGSASTGPALADALRARGAEVICIPGDQPAPLSAKPWRHVVQLHGFDGEPASRACRSALELLQVLVHSARRPLPRVWQVTCGAQPIVGDQSADCAELATVWGLARTAALEHPELRCVALDLASAAPVADLLAELTGDSPDDQVAWRNGLRYVARLARRPLPSRKQPLRAEASYLVTGGFGGLGLLIARRLIESGARHIVLLGRTPPSPAASQFLDQLDVRVAVLQSDISDLDQARCALAQISPPLAGIFHLAGVVDDDPLADQNWERCHAVLDPKLRGAWNLHTLTESLPLDFFVLFSSASAVLGTPGQSTYAAANAALDALAAYRRSLGQPATSIGWGPWADTGMAARTGAGRQWTSFGMESFTPQQGLDAFDAALGTGDPHVVVLRMNWSKLLSRVPGGSIPPLLSGLQAGPVPRVAAGIRSPVEQTILDEFQEAAPEVRATLVRDYIRAAGARILGMNPSQSIDGRLSFNELGFDSLLALELRNTLQSAFHLDLAAAAIFEHPNADSLGAFIAQDLLQLPATAGEEIVAATALVDLKAEAVLAPEIRGALLHSSAPPSAILLTGATGYLGGYCLRELLDRTDADIYCLVRARTREEGNRRLEEKLASGNPRVIPVCGDLAQPRLGLDVGEYESLAARIDSVFHSGAVVNFIQSYQSLKGASVVGTQEMLRFACHVRVKPVHHISTVAVFTTPHYRNADVIREDDPVEHWEGLMVGYAQSKWVSEKLVQIARSHQMPVAIYRPGMITGDSRSGECKLDDFMPRMIRGCIQIGAAPDMGGFVMDLVPVDYCAQAIVALALRNDSLGKAFNLVNPPAISWNRMVERIRRFGYPVVSLSYQEWLGKLRQAPADNALVYLLPVLEGLSDELFTWPRVDCRNTLEGLAGSDIVCPPAEELLDTYLSNFVRVGYLPNPGEKTGAAVR